MRVAVVIPCYNSRDQVLAVLHGIGPEVQHIIVVDDACPQKTGSYVREQFADPRLTVIDLETNLGVGGAVKAGYVEALRLNCDVVIKLDSDGQMDPGFVPRFIHAIASGVCDYAKGNRFFNPEDVRGMPLVRIIGNLGLSFLAKLSTGYWSIFDPTNGYTAIHRAALSELPLSKIEDRFFFESDMLFRLNLLGAVVADIPLPAIYGNEISNLSARKAVFEFARRHAVNLTKRIGYRYFLRDFSLGSISLLLGIPAFVLGVVLGIWAWIHSIATGEPATAGTVMLSALPTIIGVQLILNFFAQDYGSVPRVPLQKTRT